MNVGGITAQDNLTSENSPLRLDTRSNRLFQSIGNTATTHSKSPEEIKKMSEGQRQPTPPSARSASVEKQSTGIESGLAASSTPPIGSKTYSTYSTTVMPPQGLSGVNEDNQRRAPEEGLNGSNVPGLAPNHPPPSLSGSRRTSGAPDDINSVDQQGVAGNRQSANGSLNDLTSSFDRVSIGSNVKGGLRGTPPSSISGSAVGGAVSPLPSNGGTGQQSVLHRQLNRANLEHQQSGLGSGGANELGMTPVFNERFLFDDDELEADETAFVKKYNLREDDNSFPVLIRRDSHPGMVSCFERCCGFASLSVGFS
jgi:hypothetical protein